ncbi:Cytochrome b5 [Moelleriella libera RCEF 2490]|uniref:Cytochrome b5 n=1 Tax=Moelleriella libera RCEF 2490 TaxID=1081109 RepID=A0A166VC97_9HYPO|nr:Cytochrome b5 [Moelleriella libera RCEF 2490]
MAGKFEPKTPIQLDPPRDDPISVDELAKANGNKAYQPGGSYQVFAGKDASRALGKTSTKAEDVKADWHDLSEKEKQTLDDWVIFFSKRYNVVGSVEGATNM